MVVPLKQSLNSEELNWGFPCFPAVLSSAFLSQVFQRVFPKTGLTLRFSSIASQIFLEKSLYPSGWKT